jgi:hypothetical protein
MDPVDVVDLAKLVDRVDPLNPVLYLHRVSGFSWHRSGSRQEFGRFNYG